MDNYWELRKEATIVARSSAVLQPAPWWQKARAKAPRYVKRSSHLHKMINSGFLPWRFASATDD
jgi:hypothetical protein